MIEQLTQSIAENEKKIRQLENQAKMLRKQKSEISRRADAHRKIKRGGFVESLIEGSQEMSDDEFFAIVKAAFRHREYG